MILDSDGLIFPSQINHWKEASLDHFAPKICKFKMNPFNVKLFWDKLSLQEKEECLVISSDSLNNCLSTYVGMLECNYCQVLFLFVWEIKWGLDP